MDNVSTYLVEWTEDGSPSFRPQFSESTGELMHSRKGALSESLEIYAPLVQQVAKESSQRGFRQPRILSVGLGMGYNEIISLAICHKTFSDLQPQILSWEIDSKLRTGFERFFLTAISGLGSEFDKAYTAMVGQIAEQTEVSSSVLRELVVNALSTQRLVLSAALQKPFIEVQCGFHGILYDAFSSKTNPELWSEEFLLDFLKHFCHADFCLFGTYASTGALKRALKTHQFCVQNRQGFGGKRESIWASKNSAVTL